MNIEPNNDRPIEEGKAAETDRRRFLMAVGAGVAGAALPVGIASWASPAAAQSTSTR